MTEKRRLTHDLAAIKAALASSATLNRTKVATRDASALGMDAAAVVAVIQAFNIWPTSTRAPRRTTTRNSGTIATNPLSISSRSI